MKTKTEFEKNKPELIAAFKVAIEKTLVEMGDDIQGISWFSSNAEQYNENKNLQSGGAR
jgi:hypothetical protein